MQRTEGTGYQKRTLYRLYVAAYGKNQAVEAWGLMVGPDDISRDPIVTCMIKETMLMNLTRPTKHWGCEYIRRVELQKMNLQARFLIATTTAKPKQVTGIFKSVVTPQCSEPGASEYLIGKALSVLCREKMLKKVARGVKDASGEKSRPEAANGARSGRNVNNREVRHASVEAQIRSTTSVTMDKELDPLEPLSSCRRYMAQLHKNKRPPKWTQHSPMENLPTWDLIDNRVLRR